MEEERPKDWFWNRKYVETESDDAKNVLDEVKA